MSKLLKFGAVGLISAVIATTAIYQWNSMSVAAMRAKHASVSGVGKKAVVVGGTSGIGHGIALRLAAANYEVTIAGRNAERAAKIIEEMNALSSVKHHFMEIDAQYTAEAKAFVAKYAAENPTLDVLVLTQGIATVQGRTPTREGIDQKLALHFYGRMALIENFLPLLRRSSSPKVLSVLSGGVHSPYAHLKTDPELSEHFSIKNAADAAGFYNDLYLDALSKQSENSKVTFIHAAPGFVNTNWGTEMPWYLKGLIRLIQPLGTSIQDCGEFMCDPLFRDDLHGGFVVVGSRAEPAAVTAAHTDDNCDFLFRHTRETLSRTGALPESPAASAGAGTA